MRRLALERSDSAIELAEAAAWDAEAAALRRSSSGILERASALNSFDGSAAEAALKRSICLGLRVWGAFGGGGTGIPELDTCRLRGGVVLAQMDL